MASKKIHRPCFGHGFRAIAGFIAGSKTFSCLTGPNIFCDVRYGVQQCLISKAAVQNVRSAPVFFAEIQTEVFDFIRVETVRFSTTKFYRSEAEQPQFVTRNSLSFQLGFENFLRHDPTSEQLDEVLDSLDENFDLVMVADHMAESLILLR